MELETGKIDCAVRGTYYNIHMDGKWRWKALQEGSHHVSLKVWAWKGRPRGQRNPRPCPLLPLKDRSTCSDRKYIRSAYHDGFNPDLTAMIYPIVLLLAIAILIICRMLTSVRRTTPDDVKKMLDPPGADMNALLQARARANRHFESAVGVTSTFVSEDARTHEEFVGRMARTLSGADNRWSSRLVKVTEAGVTQFLPATSCDLGSFIRCVTFHVWVLGMLRPDGPPDRRLLSGDHLTVEQLTNTFFEFSEAGESVSPDHIRGALGQWIPDEEGVTPVNLVFPMYEKLWRLVAATVICSQGFPVSQNPLLDFCENPTRRQFMTSRGTEQGPTSRVADIMDEVLRLHPPIQEILRPYELPWWEKMLHGRMQVADIKAAQRFDETGDLIEEPDTFKPGRWKLERKPVMFAFGWGPLMCPVSAQAPSLAAFIASKVVESVDGVAFGLEKFDGTQRYIWDGWSIRRLLTQHDRGQ